MILDNSEYSADIQEGGKETQESAQLPKASLTLGESQSSYRSGVLLTQGKYVIDTPYLQETKVEGFKNAIEKKIFVQQEDFTL